MSDLEKDPRIVKARTLRANWLTWKKQDPNAPAARLHLWQIIELTEAKIAAFSVRNVDDICRTIRKVQAEIYAEVTQHVSQVKAELESKLAVDRAGEAVLAAHLASLDQLADDLLSKRAELIEGEAGGLLAAALRVGKGQAA